MANQAVNVVYVMTHWEYEEKSSDKLREAADRLLSEAGLHRAHETLSDSRQFVADIELVAQAALAASEPQQASDELLEIVAALEGNADYYLEQTGSPADLQHGEWLMGVAKKLRALAQPAPAKERP